MILQWYIISSINGSTFRTFYKKVNFYCGPTYTFIPGDYYLVKESYSVDF